MSKHYAGRLKIASSSENPWSIDHDDGHDSTFKAIATEKGGRAVFLVVNDDTKRPMQLHEDELDANADRLVACWNVCEGISTEVLELNATAGGVATLERQRDELLAALQSIADYAKRDGDVIAQHLGGIAKAAIAAAKGAAPAPRYTSISKGGSYEKLGAIRGAGALKGLTGIAYRDDQGRLFIREPECFAKRMQLIGQAEGGAQ